MSVRNARHTRAIPKSILRVTAMVTTGVLAVTTLAGCIPGINAGSDTSREFYKGVIPAAAPLTALSASAMPEAPVPPTDYTDEAAMEEYQRQTDEYIKQMEDFSGEMSNDTTQQFAEEVYELANDTLEGGEKAIAAWQSLLVAAGIAVGFGDNAVEVSGMTGSGIPMPLDALRLQEVYGVSEARMPLTDLADILDGGGFGITPEDLHEALSGTTDYAFSTVFLALDPTGETFFEQYYGEFRSKALEDVSLTGAQVSLVLRRLAVELAMASEEAQPAASGPADFGSVTRLMSATTSAAPVSVPMLGGAAADLCEPSEDWRIDQVKKSAKWVEDWLFGKATGDIDQKDRDRLGKLGAVSAVTAIIALLAKMFMLESDFSIGNAPLVRTKDLTPGERQDLTIELRYPETAAKDVHECVKRLIAMHGINLNDYQGPAKGVDVDLILTGNRLQYARGSAGTDAYRQKADDNGKVVFPIEGKRQTDRLPEGAEPEEVTSRVEAHANLTGSDLFSDLRSAVNDAKGGILSSVLGAIERMKLVTFTWDVPVKDWTLEGEFDMTLHAVVSSHAAANYTHPGLYGCPDAHTNRSTTALGQMNGKPHRMVAEFLSGTDDGEKVTAMFLRSKGLDVDDLRTHNNGIEVAYFEFDYGLTQQTNEPGLAPMPVHATAPGAGCGDGIGGYTPPKPDCGERTFLGAATLNMLGEYLYVTVDDVIGKAWEHCGGGLMPSIGNVASPPSSLDSCQGHYIDGGEIPNLDTIFNKSNKFEITGELRCSRDGDGTLNRFTFEWTLEFCRIVEGERAC